MCLKKIANLFFKHRYGITQPSIIIDKDVNELNTQVYAEFPQCITYFSWDYKYKVTTFNEYQRFIQWASIQDNIYIPEMFDCDNFSFALYGLFKSMPKWSGLAFGVLILREPAHAVNFFIDDKNNIWIVEPQTGNIFIKPSGWVELVTIM